MFKRHNKFNRPIPTVPGVPHRRPGVAALAIVALFAVAGQGGPAGAEGEPSALAPLVVPPLAETPVTLAQQTPRGGQGRPPREAMAACQDKPAEAACSFDTRDGRQVTGTCRAPTGRDPEARNTDARNADAPNAGTRAQSGGAPTACVPAHARQNG